MTTTTLRTRRRKLKRRRRLRTFLTAKMTSMRRAKERERGMMMVRHLSAILDV